MSAFAAAMAAIVNDPNLGTDAVWSRTGSPAVSLRVVRSSPDQTAFAFDTEVVSATDVLSVPLAALADVQPGDQFQVGADTLIVQSALLDASGTVWRVACRR